MIHCLPCLHKTLCIWLHLSESLWVFRVQKISPQVLLFPTEAETHQAITDKHTDGCQSHATMLFNSELFICVCVQKCGCDFTSYLTSSLVQNTSTCIHLLDVEIMFFSPLVWISFRALFSCNLISGLTDGVATCIIFDICIGLHVSHLVFYVNSFWLYIGSAKLHLQD